MYVYAIVLAIENNFKGKNNDSSNQKHCISYE